MTTFASDNWAGACEAVTEALARASEGDAPGYGADPTTHQATRLIAQTFEREPNEIAVFYVPTGSAANSLALAAFAKAGGVVLCHEDSHVARDEAGGPGLFAPQLIDPIDGPLGCITPDALSARLALYPAGHVHGGRPSALTLTNVNEIGALYTPQAIAALSELAHARGMAVHLDGARFCNAVAALGCTPAELTWRAGVDVLSLGLTKTGAWCAEAVVLFDPAMKEDVAFRHKQAAMLMSKNRFAAAQFVALLTDGHAFALAAHANAMAARLAQRLEACGVPLLAPPGANELFAFLAPREAEALAAAKLGAYPWATRSRALPDAPQDRALHRFVASFRTTEADVDAVLAALP